MTLLLSLKNYKMQDKQKRQKFIEIRECLRIKKLEEETPEIKEVEITDVLDDGLLYNHKM